MKTDFIIDTRKSFFSGTENYGKKRIKSKQLTLAIQIHHLKVHADFRGIVFEPLEAESIGIQKNVHIVFKDPGMIRGNHYHTNGTETVAVKGRALVCIKKNRKIQNIKVPRIRLTDLSYHQKYPMLLKT